MGGPARGRALVTDKNVLFGWGNRQGKGGVTALDRFTGKQSWQTVTAYTVEGGMEVAQDHVLFGTLGFLGTGAELNCIRAEDGILIWHVPVSGGIWSKPAIKESRVYVASDDGHIHCFDLRSGEQVSGWPIKIDPGRSWLVLIQNRLIVVSESGQISAIHPIQRDFQWSKPATLGVKVNAGPAFGNQEILVVSVLGHVFGVDVHSGKTRSVGNGYGAIMAPPTFSNEILYFGSKDHYLHAVNITTGLEIWRHDCEHSVVSSPCVADGLVFVGGNDGRVYAFDAQSGDLGWRYQLNENTPILGSPTYDDGIVYIGAENGQAYALPWHFGKYHWAAEFLLKHQQHFEAGISFTLAAHQTRSLAEREEMYAKGEECWDNLCEPEWAARFWEGIARENKAAAAYCKAAEFRRGKDNRLASKFFFKASKLYWHLAETAEAERCSSEASRLGHLPLLRIKKRNIPRMTQGKSDVLSFRLENIGYSAADSIILSLGGSLLKSETYVISTPLINDSYFDISISAVPTRENDTLVVQAEYQAEKMPEVLLQSAIEVSIETFPAPTKIKVGDVIKGNVSVITSDNRPVEIETGDMVMTDLIIDVGQKSVSVNEADFTWPELNLAWRPEGSLLIKVDTGKEAVTVPAGHWAYFLADEKLINKYAPGRYRRKDVPELRSHLMDNHIPVWKAVIFNSALFRLAFRLGPFKTREGVRVGVEFGLTLEINTDKGYTLWMNCSSGQGDLDTDRLARWLEREIAGAVAGWMAEQSEESLSPSFSKREIVLLTLLEETRQTCDKNGLNLKDPIWALNFIIPGRERVDVIRENQYWIKKRK